MLDLVGAMQAGSSMRNADLARRDRSMGSLGEGILGLAQALQQAKTQPAFLALELAREKRRQDLASSEAEKQRAHGSSIVDRQLAAGEPERMARMVMQFIANGMDPKQAWELAHFVKSGPKTVTRETETSVPSQPITTPQRPASVLPIGGGMAPPDASDFSSPQQTYTPPPTIQRGTVTEEIYPQMPDMPRVSTKDAAGLRARAAAIRGNAAQIREKDPEGYARMSAQADAIEQSLSKSPRTSIFEVPEFGAELSRLTGTTISADGLPPYIRNLYEALASDISEGGNPGKELAEVQLELFKNFANRRNIEALGEQLGGGPEGIQKAMRLISRDALAAVARAAVKAGNG